MSLANCEFSFIFTISNDTWPHPAVLRQAAHFCPPGKKGQRRRPTLGTNLPVREAYAAYPSYASIRNFSSSRVFASKKTPSDATRAHTTTEPRAAATPTHSSSTEVYIGCLTQRYTPRTLRPAPFGCGIGVSARPRCTAAPMMPRPPRKNTAPPSSRAARTVGPQDDGQKATARNSTTWTATSSQPKASDLSRLSLFSMRLG